MRLIKPNYYPSFVKQLINVFFNIRNQHVTKFLLYSKPISNIAKFIWNNLCFIILKVFPIVILIGFSKNLTTYWSFFGGFILKTL